MIQSASLENFRGIQHGRLDDLRALTILVGPNGCGKSSILEALAIGATPLETNPNSPHPGVAPSRVLNPSGRQRIESAVSQVLQWRNRRDHSFSTAPAGRQGAAEKWLLWRGDLAGSAEVTVTAGAHPRTVAIAKAPGQQLKVDVPFNGSATYPSLPDVRSVGLLDGSGVSDGRPLHTLYTVAANSGVLPTAKEIVRECLPQISDFQILTDDQEKPYLAAIFTNRAVPVSLIGDGAHALVRIALELASAGDGVVLLEEPEAHMHPAAIAQAAKAVLAAVRRGTQVILTTHSLEFIDRLVAEANGNDTEKMCLFRLKLTDGNLVSSRIEGKDVAFARGEIGEDLR